MDKIKRGQAELTIIDLTDDRKLVGFLSTSKARQVIYNPNTDTYNPDFSTENMTIKPELYISGSGDNVIATAKAVKWYYRENTLGNRQPITASNDTYTINSDRSLTIKKNILAGNLTYEFIADIEYVDPNSELITIIPTNVELVLVNSGEDGAVGFQGEPGADGKTTYTHIAWANSEDGTVDFSTTVSKSKAFVGMYVDNTEKNSTNPADYNWSQIRGNDGISVTGIAEYYLTTTKKENVTRSDAGWSGSVQIPTKEKPYLWNYEVVNYSMGDSDKSEPALIGMYAEDGVGIETVTNKYLTTSLGTGVTVDNTGWVETPVPTTQSLRFLWNYSVIKYTNGTSENTPVALIGVHGEKGDRGIQGVKGADGTSSYTHIAYANSSNGVDGFSKSDSTDKLYVGMYVDNTELDSDNPSDYKWSRIKGLDGAQGIPGTKGADGRTPYLHIAYADDDRGTVGFSINDSLNKKYMGTYTDFTANDSTNPGDYTWALIKGDDGISITAVVENYLITTLKTGVTRSTSGWTTTPQTATKAKPYLWNYKIVKYSSGSNAPTEPVMIGMYTEDGVGIESITNMYLTTTQSSGITLSSPGWSSTPDTTISTDGAPLYVWNYETINYTNGTSKNSPVALIGVHGAKGIPGAKGADGRTSYTHIAYANNDSGTSGFSNIVSEGKTHVGMYTDFNESSSTNPADYKWTLIKGADGSQGIPGKAGADGKTPYFHIAYNSVGPNMFSTRTWESTDKKVSTNVPYITLTGLSPNTKYLVTTNIPDGSSRFDVFADTDFSVKPISSGANGVPSSSGREVLSTSNGTIDVGMRSYSLSEGVYWIKVVNPFEQFSTEDSTGRTHIGQYTDYTANDSTNPNDYEWSLIKGSNGTGVNPNLLRKSNVSYDTTEYKVSEYQVTDNIPVGTMVTITVWGDLGERPYWNPHLNGASISLVGTYGEYDYINKKYVATFPWRVTSPYTSFVASPPYVIHMYGGIGGDNSGRVTIEKVKLEYGEESTPWVPAESEMEGATLAIITPDGTTIRDTTNSLKLESKLFIGGREVTANTYRWYYYNGTTTVNMSSTNTATVLSNIVKSSLPIFLEATYKGATYTTSVTINDISDVYTSIILGVATFKNGKGSNTYTVKLYRNGEEIDPGGSIYSYEWEKLNSQGVKDTTFTKTGKTITITANDIDNTNLFNCYIYTK